MKKEEMGVIENDITIKNNIRIDELIELIKAYSILIEAINKTGFTTLVIDISKIGFESVTYLLKNMCEKVGLIEIEVK